MTKSPQFNSRDATRSEFWDERFVARMTPWDKGGVPAQFAQFARSTLPTSCLIPGCGHGYETSLLAELKWDVTAIDFAPIAVANARQLFPTLADRIILADFFTYQPQQPPQIIYERAFFCALPASERQNIVRRWVALLPVGGRLAGYFHIALPNGINGPPFSVSRNELDAFLSPNFVCIEDNPVCDSIPVFKDRERWMVWQKLV